MAEVMKIDEEGYKLGNLCQMYATPRTVLDDWKLRSTGIPGHLDVKKHFSLFVLPPRLSGATDLASTWGTQF
jgi:hypothetical protein